MLKIITRNFWNSIFLHIVVYSECEICGKTAKCSKNSNDFKAAFLNFEPAVYPMV